MQKPRHLKTAMQLWIADNRKRLGLTPNDIATLTGVTTDTARGWESRGKPGPDAVAVLERRFGRPAPADDLPADQSALIAALAAQTQAIAAQTQAMLELVEAMREARDRNQDASASMIRATEVFLSRVRPPEAEGSSEQREPAGARR